MDDDIRVTMAATATATVTAMASSSSNSTSIPTNPLLQYQPSYSRSLVVQLIVLSAVGALHIVLLLHLLFTTKYHLPLAKVNYILLTSGCISSFTAVLWQIVEVALTTRETSKEWPYVFDYIQFDFPMPEWGMAKRVVWLVLGANVVFLCHAAQIHVLTLLYPSKIEKRLFMALLLPLAFISCALSFAPLLHSQREQDIFDSGTAVCNSTLTLLYTCALSFWGGYIARKRAWGQADESGSTAVFGGCALGMAVLGTVLSFVSISRSAEMVENGGWLDRVTWLVLLWQTWFTVWWWIGGGMYGAERPLRSQEEEEEEQRNLLAEKGSRRSRLRKKYVEVSLKRYLGDNLTTLQLRRRRPHATTSGHDEAEGIELSSMSRSSSLRLTAATRNGVATPSLGTHPSNRPISPLPVSEARATLDSSESSSSTTTPPTFFNTLFRTLRKAHTRAAKAAQKELLHTAGQNPSMNDAIIGRRGKGWSVSGILKSRQDDVTRRVAAGERDGMDEREDRRVGAERLDEEEEGEDEGGDATPWYDLDEQQQYQRDSPRYPPPPRQSGRRRGVQADGSPKATPVTGKRFQNWRVKDITTYD